MLNNFDEPVTVLVKCIGVCGVKTLPENSQFEEMEEPDIFGILLEIFVEMRWQRMLGRAL